MEDGVCRVLATLINGLPDVVMVKFPSITPDHIMRDRAELSRGLVAALIVLAQDQTVISLDQVLEFLLEVKEEVKKIAA